MQIKIVPVRIFISRAGESSTRLRLRDDRNNPNPVDLPISDTSPAQGNPPDFATNIEKGDLIIWELDPLSLTNPPSNGFFPIKSIDNIAQTTEIDGPQYRNSVPVLTGDPVEAGNSFVATVPNPSAGRGKFVNYRIEYTLPNGNRHVQDPQLVLNS